MREKYETLSLATLKELAKGRGMRGISTLKKGELIEAMLRQDEKDAANKDIRDTASAEGRQELQPQTNGSLSGETHNIRTSGNRTWNNPARRMNATPRPENAPERGRRNGMQQGRTYVARTQQNADSSDQPRVGRVQRN